MTGLDVALILDMKTDETVLFLQPMSAAALCAFIVVHPAAGREEIGDLR